MKKFMLKRMLFVIVSMSLSLSVYAEEKQEDTEIKTFVEMPQWMRNIRLSGYGMVQYQTTYEDKYEEEDDESSTFNLRFLRLMLDRFFFRKRDELSSR